MARRKRVNRGGRVFAALLLLGVLTIAGLGWWLRTPYAGFALPLRIEVARGAGLKGIAESLAANGVIRHPLQLLLIRALRPKATLQAGEYRFREPASAWTVFDRIARGDIFVYEVTFPEGSNLFDMGRIVGEQTHIRAEDFISAASDAHPIRDLDPHAPSLEGYLFPATYRVTRTTTAQSLVREMLSTFRKTWKEVRGGGDIHRIVTIASLVEKETALPSERPTVASVYFNRLSRDMKLECDPTTIYAAVIERRYDGIIHKSDLENRNPYNTYQHAGLPPGPIANPGRRSLEATLRPASTQFLYFVARPDHSGGHVFTTNAGDHLRAVAQYRRGNQKGKTQGASSPAITVR
ncbi:MAG: endolytic transglycosylase MltG [Bryobacteraceae bacterium]|nr:endolytic transglycosylase MltG [Bryobacteraceae bacterium]